MGMRLVVAALGPIVGTVQKLVWLMLQAFGVRGENKGIVADEVHDEIRGTVYLRHKQGSVERESRDMISGVLDLRELTDVSEQHPLAVRLCRNVFAYGQAATAQRVWERAADGSLVERDFLGLSLTFDHRAVNGAPAADFLDALCRRIEGGEAAGN